MKIKIKSEIEKLSLLFMNLIFIIEYDTWKRKKDLENTKKIVIKFEK